MGVTMQAFYVDCPKLEGKEFELIAPTLPPSVPAGQTFRVGGL